MDSKFKREKRLRRHKKVRAKIFGTVSRPRLSVFRSNQHIYCQLVDDEKGRTLIEASDLKLAKKGIGSKKKSSSSAKNVVRKEEKEPRNLSGKVNLAFKVGELVAEKALKKKIEKVVFDRGGYKYHGRVKAVAEGAREGGLEF